MASVRVHADPDAFEAAWAELERCAPCSIYQTRAFLRPWLATLSARARMTPFFVLARDDDGRPSALLPLGISRHGGVRLASWLGGRDSNLPMALLRRPQDWTACALNHLLRTAAAAPGGPDVYDLPNQPAAFAGVRNPFLSLPHAQSPSSAYATTLRADAETLFRDRLSKEARKKLRRKEAKLAEMGDIQYRVATSAEERAPIIAFVLAQKSRRLRSRGIASAFEAPEMGAFIEGAAGTGAIEIHALTLDDRIVAAYGGGVHGGQWSGMFNAFDPSEEIARCSPGDLLLMRIVSRCCARGIARFDLGIGEARYKAALCDETMPLLDVIVATSLPGQACAMILRLRQAAKRRIKRDPRLHEIAVRLGGLVG